MLPDLTSWQVAGFLVIIIMVAFLVRGVFRFIDRIPSYYRELKDGFDPISDRGGVLISPLTSVIVLESFNHSMIPEPGHVIGFGSDKEFVVRESSQVDGRLVVRVNECTSSSHIGVKNNSRTCSSLLIGGG